MLKISVSSSQTYGACFNSTTCCECDTSKQVCFS